jgi:phosphatidate cytidylyltransferase
MTCPKTDMSFTSPPACVTPPVFTPQPYRLPDALLSALSSVLPAGLQPPHILLVSAFQLHALTLAVFASLIAPFGGFFASGFKRAFHIKDFGESIPGHGGVTDRMDCQVLMGFFVWVYYGSFVVREGGDERWSRITKIIDRMELEEMQRLYAFIGQALLDRGVQLLRAEL